LNDLGFVGRARPCQQDVGGLDRDLDAFNGEGVNGRS
jgi:hypothetical protein